MDIQTVHNAPLQNIMIIGSSGSGKSTLAQTLAEMLCLRVIHIDHIYWKPNWVMRSQEEIAEGIEQAIEDPGWVFEGNHSKTFRIRTEKADTIIWLDLPRWKCILQGLLRTIRNMGHGRPDMAEGCADRFSWALIRWQWCYGNNGRKKAMKLFQDTEGKLHQVILHSPAEVAEFVNLINDIERHRRAVA